MELVILTREVNGILAGCPAFWCSSDVPLLARRITRGDLQQLHHQVLAFVESVRTASRWGAAHTGLQEIPIDRGRTIVERTEDVGETLQVEAEVGGVRQAALALTSASRGHRARSLQYREVPASSEARHHGAENSIISQICEIWIRALVDTTSLLQSYLAQHRPSGLQNIPCVLHYFHSTTILMRSK